MNAKAKATIRRDDDNPKILHYSIALVIDHIALEPQIEASKFNLQAMLTRNLVERLRGEAEKLDPEAVQWRWV